jgi:hypothetical protein
MRHKGRKVTEVISSSCFISADVECILYAIRRTGK